MIGHANDTGIRAHGRNLPELFVNAIEGMTAIMAEPDQITPRETRSMEIEAEDRESLLVEWLNETICLSETEQLLFGQFKIDFMSDTRLLATVAGEKPDQARHGLKTQIKAVTDRDLKVEKNNSSWLAQVVFDVC